MIIKTHSLTHQFINYQIMLTNHVNQIPIPLEISYLMKDGKKKNDDVNKYIFKYKKEWLTSDKGEMIIGVRTIWFDIRRRKLKYNFGIRKYSKDEYLKIKGLHPDWNDNKIFYLIDDKKKAEIEFDCVYWLPVEEDRRGIWKRFIKVANYNFTKYNEKHPDKDETKFDLYEDYDKQDTKNREAQWDGGYDNDANCFVETRFSPRNNNPEDNYYVDISLDFETEYDKDGKLIRTDFMDIMNIGDGPFENEPEQYKYYQRQMNFYNVWDRHSCKVCASFANDSNRNYVGNSQSLFNPIKYYKVNSTSDTFTISLYSSRHPEFPVKLSNKENMVIEMQLLQHNKLLYI